MAKLLGLVILSFAMTFILLVPFIDFLYKIKLRRATQVTLDPFHKQSKIFDKFNNWKVGTPFGGGILIILVVTVVTLWAYGIFGTNFNPWALFVILFSFIGFGLLGLYDDFKKLINEKHVGVFGLRLRYKFIIQWILAFIIAFVFYEKLGYSYIFIRFIV